MGVILPPIYSFTPTHHVWKHLGLPQLASSGQTTKAAEHLTWHRPAPTTKDHLVYPVISAHVKEPT